MQTASSIQTYLSVYLGPTQMLVTARGRVGLPSFLSPIQPAEFPTVHPLVRCRGPGSGRSAVLSSDLGSPVTRLILRSSGRGSKTTARPFEDTVAIHRNLMPVLHSFLLSSTFSLLTPLPSTHQVITIRDSASQYSMGTN